MKALRLTLPRALLALAIWLFLTIGIGLALGDGHHHPLAHDVGQKLGWPWLLAAAFALSIAWRAGPDAMGLHLPSPLRSVWLAWLPMAYVGLLLAVDLLTGAPPPGVIAIVAINMLLVGLSEELMFRSIVFRGMLAHFRVWPAVLLTSLLFGMAHSLNVVGTGQLEQALMQSVTAFMQGLAYLAIRIRTGSVWPMVVVHALWDFSLMLTGLAHPPSDGANPEWQFLPLLIALPIFLYGIFLLRHLRRDYSAWSEISEAGRHSNQGRL